MLQALEDLLASLTPDYEKLFRAKAERSIPGATVTIKQWESLVDETNELFGKLVETSSFHFGFLDDALPEQITLCPPSKGLAEVNTEKLLERLTAAEKQLSELQAQFPDKADWAQLMERVSRLREAWPEFAASDFKNEQVVASVNFTLKGARPVVERIITLVREQVDKETVSALVGHRVGFLPEITRDIPVVLHGQGGPFPLFATGDAVKNLLETMGVTVVPTEEVLRFVKDSLAREIENLDDEEDDDDLAVDDDVTEGAPASA